MKLKDARYLRNMTLMKLGKLTGVHYTIISNYEMGYRKPTTKHIKKLERALNLKGCIDWELS